jgi:hypothetical protein
MKKFLFLLASFLTCYLSGFSKVNQSVSNLQVAGLFNFDPSSYEATVTVLSHVNCFGGNNGSVNVSVTGGTSPYTYAWSTNPVQTTDILTGLTAGTYTVTVTDAVNSTTTASATVTQPTALSAFTTVTHVACFGNATGSVSVTASGGTIPYSYAWSTNPVMTTQCISGLTSGVYFVTVTDSKGCNITASDIVTQPGAGLSANAIVISHVACNGGSNGLGSVNVSGGTQGYSYFWSTNPIQTTQAASGLTAGNYFVTVTDAHGCTSHSNITITQPALLQTQTNVTSHVTCAGGNDGSASVSASGGTTPYSYLWSTIPAKTDPVVTDLIAGIYYVTVTDAKGCTNTGQTTITQPAPLLLMPSVANPILCNGNNNGAVTVSVSGGTPGYSYTWSTIPIQTTKTASNLQAGSYTVTVTDAHGCTGSIGITITQPPILNASASVISHVSCFNGNDGSLIANGSGGTPGYTYLWSTNPVQTTQFISGLSSGNYMLTVTDAFGCKAVSNAVITQPSALSAVVSVITPISCSGGNNGVITVDASGGTPGYTYLWSTSPVQTTKTVSGLGQGTYYVIVSDALGCEQFGEITLTEPSPLTVNATVISHVSCHGGSNGSATAQGTGGTPDYSYLWSTSPQKTTQTITGLSVGVYQVTVTDSHGCSSTSGITITQPSLLQASISIISHVSCYGGNNGWMVANPAGGTPGYTYSWSTNPVKTTKSINGLSAGTYSVVITDSKGCSATASAIITQPLSPLSADPLVISHVTCHGSNDGVVSVIAGGGTPAYSYAWSTIPVQTVQTISGLSAGYYNVLVTDSKGCKVTTGLTVTQPSAPLIAEAVVVNQITCFGMSNGSAKANVAGGTPSYNYSWSTTPVQTTQIATGLSGGNYTVTVSDSHGCIAVAGITIINPTLLTAHASVLSHIMCNGATGGAATVAATGGTPDYSFLWSTSPPATTQTVNNLSPGAYVVTVSDANACTATSTVTITQPEALITNATAISHNTCFGQNNGIATVSVSGGTPSYLYSWSTIPIQTTQTATALSSNTYGVTVTDAHGCTSSAFSTITQPDNLIVTPLVISHVSCYNQTNGSAIAVPTGGTPGYSFLWSTSPPQTTMIATGLTVGSYVVTVTDAQGCSSTAAATVTQPSELTISDVALTHVACNGQPAGSVCITVSGGTPGYTYYWNTPGNTSCVTGLLPGTYAVIVTDSKGCTVSGSWVLTQPASPLITVHTFTHVSCYGYCNGLVTTTTTGGTPPYGYSWSNGASSSGISGLCPGVYHLTVTDAHGCTAYVHRTITQPLLLTTGVTSITHLNCYGQATGAIEISAGGGTSPYLFYWSNSNTTKNISGLTAGLYAVTVTDSHGCTATTGAHVTQPAAPLITSTSTTHVTCYGYCNGSITTTTTGGTPPYTFAWNNGATTPSLTGLCAGTYSLTVTDSKGCITSAGTIVTQPAILTISNVALSHIACYGQSTGSVCITVSGGTPGYTYYWNTPGTTSCVTGLFAGIYAVIVTDSKGCTISGSWNLSQPALPLITDHTFSHISCYGNCDGSVNTTTTGGTPPYGYSWSNGASSSGISGLCPGVYHLTVTDAHGCTAFVHRTITQPPLLTTGVASITHVNCYGQATGAIEISAGGGTSPYLFYWSNSNTTKNISGLTAGLYTVTVTDSHGCTATTGAHVTQPAAPLITSISTTHVTCYGSCNGSISTTPTGGTPPYTFAWNNGATTSLITGICAGLYSLTVTDSKGCITGAGTIVTQPATLTISNVALSHIACYGQSTGSVCITVSGGTPGYTYYWNTPGTTSCVTGLFAGIYAVIVTDSKGCTVSGSWNLTQPALPLITDHTFSHISCYGNCNGSVTTTTAGGTPPYGYLWSNGASTSGISNLCPDTYHLTVTDAHGCTAFVHRTITQPPLLTTGVTSITHVNCYGQATGAIEISAGGGTSPYLFYWSNSNTTKNISGLTAGLYSVTVTDSRGCTATTGAHVTQPAAPLTTSTATTHVTCYGSCDGSINTTTTGGTLPYIFAWNNGATTASISALCAGTYSLTVSDSKGCNSISSITITQPPLFIATAIVLSHVSVNGGSDGSASVNVSGGTTPYFYAWSTSPIQTIQTITGLTAGTYTVSVTDAQSCTATSSVTITQPTGPVPVLIIQNHNVASGITECFDALQTIYVAGSGTYFTVQNNGSVTLIAGQKIFLQPGTKVFAGGYLHAYITTNNQFCTYPENIIIGNPPEGQVSTGIDISEGGLECKIYPNPTPGSFTMELTGTETNEQVIMTIYNMFGKRVIEKYLYNENKCVISLGSLPVGFYNIRIQSGSNSIKERIIKM